MTEPMPTRKGDVVVSHRGTGVSLCAVWIVEADLQQTPSPSTYVSIALGTEAAFKLAKRTIRKRRRADVFLFDQGSLTWTKPSLWPSA